jgi:hypothetical protein
VSEREWSARPEVVQNLFNPAFGALLLVEAIIAHGELGLDFPLSYIVLPLVLQKEVRKSLPRDARTSLPAWTHEHGDLLILVPKLVSELKDFTNEAILFAGSADRLKVISGGRLIANGKAVTAPRLPEDPFGEIGDCVSRARFVGKWFARAGGTANVFGVLGIRP